MSFQKVINKYRTYAFSERDKGSRFERLMQGYLQTDSKYAGKFKKVWLWMDFPAREDLGGGDTGIDLVGLTDEGDYWAIQCKCFQENDAIDKPAVDSFLTTSGRSFKAEGFKETKFAHRLWISTTNKWSSNATEAIKNQNPPVSRLNLSDLQEAPVDWEKLEQGIHGEASRIVKKEVRTHQQKAIDKANEHFKASDRGKLIMACGTGKTFTALRLAENETNGKGVVLFLVPSIALLGQTLREWSADANEPINAVCICSDPDVSKKKTKNEDSDNFNTIDLALPASTRTQDILKQFDYIKNNSKKNGMTVVFSTYQSIEVISNAQKKLIEKGFGEFDLIICDEAHRTTGVSLLGEDESAFTRVHDNNFIKAKKRLYMTATPRLYSEDAKTKAQEKEAFLCSMDDESLYGKEIYRIGFSEAVEKDLLTDYKVLILTLNENDVPPAVQRMIADKESEISSDDASKLIGCINALSKQILGDDGSVKTTDPEPMKRAVAFCPKIVFSKKITATFNTVTEAYVNDLPVKKRKQMVSVESQHIDGSMTAPERDEKLSWLKAETDANECRILTNVRCLSEGVDVPSLDAVMFLSARNSQVDVVQSVGRVMRKAPNKRYGYIIIPVVVPAGVEADKALDDNERYKVVWTVLNALRAHDDRFEATINKIDLNKQRPEQILVGRPEYTFNDEGGAVEFDEEIAHNTSKDISQQFSLQFEQLQSVVFARMVEKVGSRTYWEQWAKDVAKTAEKQVERINKLVTAKKEHQKAFDDFLSGLQENINPSISYSEAVEMLSQHIITKPIFEALFKDYSFINSNPISISMQKILDLLELEAIDKDLETLERFYESVRRKASDIDNAQAKQKIINDLYDKFFKTAFPKMVEKLGIVYTPIEVVDFMLHSVNDVLKKEFNRSLSDENIYILDPFTGTGTFITRLLQTGIINKKDLPRKYEKEIFANEIVLLAYYIAAISIENAYHDIMNEESYSSFEGICLTDTFQLGESDGSEKIISVDIFPQNSARVVKQKKAPLRIIFGNPPYSVGQKSANDDAKNQKYPKLDINIKSTYAKDSKANSVKALYDSYIKAFRWSSDRLDPQNGGIVCFISNGAWLYSNGMDSFRNSLEKEFSSIYVFNLRGDQRTDGELSRKEGGKIFGSGSRTPIAITLLVKNLKDKKDKASIFYHDIGDYLSREEKLSIVKNFSSMQNSEMKWQVLKPNVHGDWINHRTESFSSLTPLGEKQTNKLAFFFSKYANGIITSRDAWAYNFSKIELKNNALKTIDFYNQQRVNFHKECEVNSVVNEIENFIDNSEDQISWSRRLKKDLSQNRIHKYRDDEIVDSLYRPFCRQKLYLNSALVEYPGLISKFFVQKENVVICTTGIASKKDFSVLISSWIPDFQVVDKDQCFPLYCYEEKQSHKQLSLFDENPESKFIRRDNVSDFILARARENYGTKVNKEDIFYYVYGFLHSPEYRETFANDLQKSLPRLLLVDEPEMFWAFSKAGRELAELHLNYETFPAYKTLNVTGVESQDFKVEKMRFRKQDNKECKDTIIYNDKVTISNIPMEAYGYVVNGKSAIQWIMERYQVKIDTKSRIKNDPNDWSNEVGNPRYILDLLLSIINVSVQTVEIVNNLPKVDFRNL